jgi:hypothetical protein
VEEGVFPAEVGTATLAHCRRCERLLIGLLKRYRPVGRSR